MYGLCIKKPLNVQDATLILAGTFDESLAVLLYNSPMKSHPSFESHVHLHWSNEPAKYYDSYVFAWYGTNAIPWVKQRYKISLTPSAGMGSVRRLGSGHALPSGIGPKMATNIFTDSMDIEVSLSAKDLLRLNHVARYVADQDDSFLDKIAVPIPSNSWKMDPLAIRGLKLHEGNLKSHLIKDINLRSLDLASVIHFSAMALIPLAYGAIHLAALRLEFPSPIEKILWEASCYVLLGTAGVTVIAYIAISYSSNRIKLDITLTLYSIRRRVYFGFLDLFGTFLRFSDLVESILKIFFFWMCAASRTYIVKESFISLRHVPVGVYQTPPLNIMGWVPHP